MWLYLNGLDQSLTAKSNPIVKQCCSHEWPMNHYPMHLSGMTSQHLTDCLSMGLSTSYMEGFRARTLALQDLEKAWKESEADCFLRSCAWPKKLSPSSYSLKTFQLLQAEGDFKSLERLPKWGMTVDGVLYPLQALARYTVEKGGFYWPTSNARDWKGGKTQGNRHSPNLNTAVHMWPTPNLSDCYNANVKNDHDIKKGYLRGVVLNQSNTGERLCPKWVSVLMGYPIEWTDLKALETQSCPVKLEKLLKS